MTLEEWEAKQAAARAGAAPLSQQQLSDEELARQLQRQLDLEAAQERAAQAQASAGKVQGLGRRAGKKRANWRARRRWQLQATSAAPCSGAMGGSRQHGV